MKGVTIYLLALAIFAVTMLKSKLQKIISLLIISVCLISIWY
jgi:hypothetical protein